MEAHDCVLMFNTPTHCTEGTTHTLKLLFFFQRIVTLSRKKKVRLYSCQHSQHVDVLSVVKIGKLHSPISIKPKQKITVRKQSYVLGQYQEYIIERYLKLQQVKIYITLMPRASNNRWPFPCKRAAISVHFSILTDQITLCQAIIHVPAHFTDTSATCRPID